MNYSCNPSYDLIGTLNSEPESIVNLHIDFSIDYTTIFLDTQIPGCLIDTNGELAGHHTHISGSLEINGVSYNNIQGDMLFNFQDLECHGAPDSSVFILYDSEGNNIFNFLQVQEYFRELDQYYAEDFIGDIDCGFYDI